MKHRPLWPLLTAALIGLPVLYVASFGPACWWASRCAPFHEEFLRLYGPLIRLYSKSPRAIQWPFQGFVELGMPVGAEFTGVDFAPFYFDER